MFVSYLSIRAVYLLYFLVIYLFGKIDDQNFSFAEEELMNLVSKYTI